MQISIVKGVRKIKLTKRERDSLENARELIRELANSMNDLKGSEAFTQALDGLTDGLEALDGTDATTTNKPAKAS